jgi:hypothetical protein
VVKSKCVSPLYEMFNYERLAASFVVCVSERTVNNVGGTAVFSKSSLGHSRPRVKLNTLLMILVVVLRSSVSL